MSATGYSPISFTAGEIPTAAQWNQIGTNDASFNTGNGINDNAIVWRTLASDIIPTGTVHVFAGTSAPSTAWLICDGSAVSRSTYSSLFALIGTTHGAGDGSTTFNLPNLKGKTVFGLDGSQTEFNAMGKTGGSKDIMQHTHWISGASYDDGNFSGHGGNTQDWGLYADSGTYSSTDPNHSFGRYGGSTGTGTTNLNPYIVLNYIIKT